MRWWWLAGLLGQAACGGEGPASAVAAEAGATGVVVPTGDRPRAAVWPEAGAGLRALAPLPSPGRRLRIIIDAGHGAPGNVGNTSVRCELEQDFTRRVQDEVVARLVRAPELEVRAGRPDAALVDYGARITAFDGWPADAVVSLHSDARAGDGVELHPVTGCWSVRGAAGFSVLFSDEGPPGLTAARERLAREVAGAMTEAGFAPYSRGYSDGLYGTVADGVFVDRHAKGKRIRMLRGTHVPTVIVETHQAFDPEEAERWTEPATLDAFAAALRRAVVAATTSPE